MDSTHDSLTWQNTTANTTTPTTGNFPVNSSELFLEYRIGEWLFLICPPILSVAGMVGNSIAILVLTRKDMNQGTMSVYLVTLAVVDLGVLITGLLRYSGVAIFHLDIRTLSDASCKVHVFATYFLGDFSGWILVSITTERALAIRYPRAWNFTKRKAALTLISIGIALFLLNAHLLYGTSLISDGTASSLSSCWWTNSKEYLLFMKFWVWLDLCLYSILPFACLFVGNAVIIGEIKTSRKRMARFKTRADDKENSSSHTLSKMLVAMSVLFLLCSLPISVYSIVLDIYPEWLSGPHGGARNHLFYSACAVLMHVNNTVNFYLYCLSGAKFKRELMKMLRCTEHTTSQPQAKTILNSPRSEITDNGTELFTVNVSDNDTHV